MFQNNEIIMGHLGLTMKCFSYRGIVRNVSSTERKQLKLFGSMKVILTGFIENIRSQFIIWHWDWFPYNFMGICTVLTRRFRKDFLKFSLCILIKNKTLQNSTLIFIDTSWICKTFNFHLLSLLHVDVRLLMNSKIHFTKSRGYHDTYHCRKLR